MKLLLIGYGIQGKRFHKTIQEQFPLIDLEIATKQNWRQRLESKEFQGAIIATQPDTHLDIGLFCLENNIPILIEKPIVLTKKELKQFDYFSQMPILVNYTHLFSEPYQRIKQLIDPAEIKTILSFGYNWGPFRNYSSLQDYGPHDLAMILDLVQQIPNHIEIINILSGMYNIQLNFKTCFTKSLVGNTSSTKERNLAVYTPQNIYSYNLHSIQEKLPLYYVLDIFTKAITGILDTRLGLDLSHKILNILDSANNL